MIRFFICIFLLSGPVFCKAQYNERTAAILLKLDSLRKENSVTRHFAAIYFEATDNALSFFGKMDQRIQELTERCEASFASFFFRAAETYRSNGKVPAEWEAYYKDSTAPSLRYILFGINAHINGDLWQAIVTEFSAEEIAEFRAPYMKFNRVLERFYGKLYETAYDTSRKIRMIHHASFGLDKPYGKLLLYRWRRKQIRMAELYYSDRALFERKLKKSRQKMSRLNNLIRRNI